MRLPYLHDSLDRAVLGQNASDAFVQPAVLSDSVSLCFNPTSFRNLHVQFSDSDISYESALQSPEVESVSYNMLASTLVALNWTKVS